MTGNQTVKETIKAVINEANNQLQDINIDESQVESAIGDDPVQLIPDLEAKFSCNLDISFGEKIGKKNKFYLQSVRLLGEQNYGLKGKIPIETGTGVTVKVGAGVGKTYTRNLWEFWGDNTITYVRNIYTGLKERNQDEEWNQLKTDNKGFFKRLFNNLINDDSNAAKEMVKTLEDIEDISEGSQQSWKSAIDNYRGQQSDDNYNTLIAVFDKVMLENFNVQQQKSNDKLFNRYKSRTLKDYAANRLMIGIEKFANAHNVPEDISNNPADISRNINDLIEWAEDNFETKQSNAVDQEEQDYAFKILQQAYSLDYANQTLKDLLISKNTTQRSKTVEKSLNNNLIEDALKNPKLYIKDGVSGQLVRQGGRVSVELPSDIPTDTQSLDELNTLLENKLGTLVTISQPSDKLLAPIQAFMAHYFNTDLSEVKIQMLMSSSDDDASTEESIKFRPGEYDSNDISQDALKKVATKIGELLQKKDSSRFPQEKIEKCVNKINRVLPNKYFFIKNNTNPEPLVRTRPGSSGKRLRSQLDTGKKSPKSTGVK